jgi:hypothetical protein
VAGLSKFITGLAEMNSRGTVFSRAISLRWSELTSKGKGSYCDRLGIGLSLLCLIHCFLLPFAVMLMPALELFPAAESSAHGEGMHLILLFFIIPAAYLGWVRGYRHHRNISVIITGMVGLGLLLLAFQFTDTLIHVVLTSIGGLMIMFTHFVNLRVWKACC